MTDGIPPMKPLAPIVDQLREVAQEEIPAPRTCRVKLWDDGTFDAYVFHSSTDGERQTVRYDRTTSEILWEHHTGAGWEETPLTDGESIIEPVFEDATVRVVTTVDPPYKENE